MHDTVGYRRGSAVEKLDNLVDKRVRNPNVSEVMLMLH